MIRLILLLLDLIIIAVISIIAYPLSRLIGLFSKDARDNFCFGFAKLGMKSFLFLAGTKVNYKGLENLPKKGDPAVAYIGNHRGMFDIVSVYSVLPSITGFIAKKELRSFPVVGWWMSSVYCIFLDRSDKRQGVASILKGVENIKNGKSMLIYPEGTRCREEGALLPFHKGSFKLATKAKAPIIPVIVSNSPAVLEDHKPFVKSVKLIVEFLPKIELNGLSNEELLEIPDRVHDLILERAIENGRELGSLPQE